MSDLEDIVNGLEGRLLFELHPDKYQKGLIRMICQDLIHDLKIWRYR